MAYVWEVAKALGLLTEIDADEKECVEAVCQQALDEINAKLKPDVVLTDPRITSAAAGFAFYSLCVSKFQITCRQHTIHILLCLPKVFMHYFVGGDNCQKVCT